jgi:hypothetical protein
MGLLLQNNLLHLTDASNNVKFTTAHRMPHILGQVSGSLGISDITYFPQVGYIDPEYVWTGPFQQSLDEYTLIVNSNALRATAPGAGEPAVFTQAFIQASAGSANYGNTSVVANGSVMLRVLRDGLGHYAGAIIVTIGPSPADQGAIYIHVKKTFASQSGYLVNPSNENYLINLSDKPNQFGQSQPYNGTNTGSPGYIIGSGLTINYLVYYGRFA